MKTIRPTLFAALLLLLAVFHPSTSQAQTRVAINIDGGGGRLHTVVIELDERNAPKTSANFKKLATEGFYRGIAFHRVVPNYLVQIGDPLTKDPKKRNLWGTGGPGYTVPAETGQKHVRGSVAMARLSDGVNPSRASNGSQFYVCLADIPSLNGDYTVFGKVVSGLEHLDRISLAAADTNNNPAARIQVTGTRIEGDPNASIASTTTARPQVKPPTAAAAAATLAAAEKPATPAPAPAPAPAAMPKPAPAPDPAPTPTPAASPSPSPASATTADASKPAPAPAPTPAPAPATSPDSSPKATPGSALAATLAAAAGSKPKSAAAATPPSAAPVGAPSAAAAGDAASPLPDSPPSGNDDDDFSADLTQPSLADDMNADRPDGSTEPTKKEGLFTRILKRVW